MAKKFAYVFLTSYILLCVPKLKTADIKISMQQTQITGVPENQHSIALEYHRPISLLWYLAGGAYIITTAYALHARYLLNNLNAWNNWKNNIPLSDLASMPQKNVYDMLTKSIEFAYNCPPGTATMNLTNFLQDTNSEIETFSNYTSVANALQAIYIAPLFFISADSVKQAEEKIKRLRFMQSIVATELEPTNSLRRLNLINCACQKCQSLMQRVLGRHH